MGFAVGAVAVGLLAFLIGGDLLSSNSKLLGKKELSLANINGEEVSLEEFNRKLEENKTTFFVQNNRVPNESELVQIREQSWNNILFEKVYKTECNKLGVIVSEEEAWDMVQGNNIHSAIIQSFSDAEGRFEKNKVISYLQNIQKQEPKQQYMWAMFEKNLSEERLKSKYENLIKNTTFATKEEGKRLFKNQTDAASALYAFVPYSVIPDNAANIQQVDVEEYIENRKQKFQIDPTVYFEYAIFPITPTAQDTALIFSDLIKLKSEFAASKKDTAMVKRNSDSPENPKNYLLAQLPTELVDRNIVPQSDSVYGPFLDNGKFTLYKTIKVFDDTVFSCKASHILFKSKSKSPEDKALALGEAKKVLADIKAGAKFEEKALAFGTDGTSQKGGDLGWFQEKRMVKPFSDAVFNAKSIGLLPEPIETDFGYHIIKITANKTKKNFQIAKIVRDIEPSDETKSKIYDLASNFAANSPDINSFRQNLQKNPTIQKQVAYGVSMEQPNINNLSNAREIVRWAFQDAEEGVTAQDIFESDNNYIVPSLVNRSEKGTATFEDVKDMIYTQVLNEKKAKMIKDLIGTASSLEQVVGKFKENVSIQPLENFNLSSPYIVNIGMEPSAIGAAYGLAKGKVSKPIVGEAGVFVFEKTSETSIPDPKVYNDQRTQIMQMEAQRSSYSMLDVLKKLAKTSDNRLKFF